MQPLQFFFFLQGISGRCYANFINEGVIPSGEHNGTVAFFRLNQQDGVDHAAATFTCTLTGPVGVASEPCKIE